MCLSDTAEYWWDVKRNNTPYMGKQYYHIPNANCGRRHWNDAKALDDVNCDGCLKLISDGYEHNLPDGKTDFRSKAEKKRQAKVKRIVSERNKLSKCSCGGQKVVQINKDDKRIFFECSNYTKCEITSKFNEF